MGSKYPRLEVWSRFLAQEKEAIIFWSYIRLAKTTLLAKGERNRTLQLIENLSG